MSGCCRGLSARDCWARPYGCHDTLEAQNGVVEQNRIAGRCCTEGRVARASGSGEEACPYADVGSYKGEWYERHHWMYGYRGHF